MESGVIAAFVFSAENDEDSAWEGVERLESGVDVRGFRIVVIADAIAFSDKFEAMLDPGKGADGFGDAIRLRAGKPRGRNGGENILEIVRAGKRDFR